MRSDGKEQMPSAEDVLSETFRRFMKNWTFIISLRQVADVALPIAEEALRLIHTDYIERVAVDPEYKNMVVKFDGSEGSWDEDFKTLIRTGMTESALANASAGIDAASLVFAQSILDDCAWSYLKVCSLACPTDWDAVIGAKKVDFNSLQGKTPATIRSELIEEKLKQLERESLLMKVDLLFRLCPPPDAFAPINNYRYDRDRLGQIDASRQEIVHKDGMGKPLPNVDDDLDFISKTVNYLMALVNRKYGVQLNVIKVFNLPIPSELLQELSPGTP